MSADTATTHSGDRISPGSITTARLRHRRGSSLKRETISSNSMKMICGCLLSTHSVIQIERSQTRPTADFRVAALKHSAVIAIA